MTKPTHAAYPLMATVGDDLTSSGGRRLAEVTLDAVAADALAADDIQVSAATLAAQADIAEQAGYRALAQNLRRAAELTAVPNEELLKMYEQVRPGRSTYIELVRLADRLEQQFAAPITAEFVREAAQVYRNRNLLRRV